MLPKWHRNIGTVRLSLAVQIISPLQLLENAKLDVLENVVSAKAGQPEPPDVLFLSVVCFAPGSRPSRRRPISDWTLQWRRHLSMISL
jgi:hypothetical protein